MADFRRASMFAPTPRGRFNLRIAVIKNCNSPQRFLSIPSSGRVGIHSFHERNGRLAFLFVASLTAAVIHLPSLLEEKVEKETSDQSSPFSFQLDVDFMDRLARKPYLNFRSSTSTGGAGSAKEPYSRPEGVPTSLRILTVDLPEISRHGVKGGGGCRLAADRVFPDGIAPPKKVNSTLASSTGAGQPHPSDTLSVEQKAWVSSLYECHTASSSSAAVGVQILQASTAALNPANMRHNVQVGKYRYDPGKYYVRDSTNPSGNMLHPDEDSTRMEKEPRQSGERGAGSELEAPWHQYAWLEELELRLSGQVGFGESLEPAGFWDRYVWGHVYKRTVRSTWSVLDSLGVTWNQGRRRDLYEIETHGSTASHKPHVVIANGEALQRVPHALRWLQKTCRDQGVPLFVVKDPRRWGANTLARGISQEETAIGANEEDFGPVLRQVRRTVKDRIVQACLRAGTGFDRGLRVGRMEANARWEAKELVRKSKEVFQGSPDWRKLDERQLEMKLRERGIIEDDVDSPTKKRYAKSFVSLASKCIKSDQQQQQHLSPATGPQGSTARTTPESGDDEALRRNRY